MKQVKQHGIWLEVTTLLIPGVNDDREELYDMANFIAQELGIETPWHLSRFSPDYRMAHTPPTPISSLRLAHQIGRDAGLRYVYLGNVREGADTVCHACGEVLVRRTILGVAENRVGAASRCPNCGTPVGGVGMAFTSPPLRLREGRPLDS
jgi:pyruvate formate lyase activating enzyme